MANTRGGLIVFGMAEERGTGAATAIDPVDVEEGVQRRLRALAASNIHPFVSGLSFVPVEAPNTSGRGLLVLLVPQSVDAPHVIGQQSRVGIPYRDGPETAWMRERDLENAYRERFARRAGEQARLGEEIRDVRERIDLVQGTWVVASAVSRTPMPAVHRTPGRDEITAMLLTALGTGTRIIPGDDARPPVIRNLDSSGARNPRVGLRRWIAHPPTDGSFDALTRYTHVEIHDDGTATLAVQAEGWYEPVITGAAHLPKSIVESFCADLVALVDAVGRRGGSPMRYGIEIDVIRRDVAEPIVVVDQFRVGHIMTASLEVPGGSRQVRTFRSVISELAVPAEDDDLREAARRLAHDVLGQFGIERLRLLGG